LSHHEKNCRAYNPRQENRMADTMSVSVKFMRSGSFHAGESLSIDLDKVSKLEINRLRNTCELLAYTPANPQQNNPYVIARRESEYMLKDILSDLQQLKQAKRDITYEITDTEVHQVKKVMAVM
jgi:hypothetical protein